MYSSASKRGFYTEPYFEDCVEIGVERHKELIEGESKTHVIDWGEDGLPYLKERPVALLTAEQVELNRITEYTNPFTGSDRYFNESSRMKAMGEEGWEEVRDKGVLRYNEIKALNPWPKADK